MVEVSPGKIRIYGPAETDEPRSLLFTRPLVLYGSNIGLMIKNAKSCLRGEPVPMGRIARVDLKCVDDPYLIETDKGVLIQD